MAKEVKSILEHIQANHHFLLNGGAGSGKTHTLVEVIRNVLKEFPSKGIACITYTNAAALEIERRVNNEELRVSTIHDFLWDCIKNYQRDLKKTLINLINDQESSISIKDSNKILPDNYFDSSEKSISIEYREYRKLHEGIISHDEVLVVAKHMFAHSKRLVDIVKSRFSFIFIDEYQDTQPEVIDIFLSSFQLTDKHCVLGFFGDSMQSIYDKGIGSLDNYLHTECNPEGLVFEVQKEDNYRNPVSVIDIANKLRLDELVQRPTNNSSAKNVVDGIPRVGSAVFYYSENVDGLSHLYEFLSSKGWNFSDSKQTKELRLTHNLIANEAGFQTLYDIHAGDKILDYAKKVKEVISSDLDFSEDQLSNLTFGKILNDLAMNHSGNKKWSPTQGQREYISEHQPAFELAKSYNFFYLLKCHVSKDDIIDDNHDELEGRGHSWTASTQSPLIKHLNKIEKCIRFFEERNYNEFVRCSSFKSIVHFSQKTQLKEAIQRLASGVDSTIGDAIQIADELNIRVIDDKLRHYIDRNNYVYQRVCSVLYSEFRSLFDYNALRKPFSTQHKTKGLEYNNVLVILNNGKWSKYNFNSLFTDVRTSPSVLERTRKLFYVCCTRTIENLAVYFPMANHEVVLGAKKMFGENNVVKL